MLTVETEDTGAAADKDDDDDDVAVRSRLLILSRTPFIFSANLSKAGLVWSVHGLMQLAQAEGLKVARQQLG